ncbi:RIP metalloprotease RseP [Kushneria marisflavi]|uniref:Zinc metalloprotease n=1 Tax=Kushneria marisflavi TaxID=157779 RepID=A0A240UQL1_9GAMM|nr:RIP metalloprotease RseP [Kushneria marisflavi]ART63768.1 RIP metalloprotease RseP [Kushneria marisflavi]RKD85459.1 site-2 protease [Kushneria marisflavi]
MGILQNIIAVIVVLGLLITIHEFGHFWVARRCGIRVLRFSVGFGKPLISRVDRYGTEFALAAIPLGGYVKMLDECEGPVDPSEQHLAFNRQHVLKRIAVVIAGPLANFILAVVAYWVMFMAGTTAIVPMVGEVTPDSPAAHGGLKNGQEIVSVQGRQTPDWNGVNLALVAEIGATGHLEISTRDEQGRLESHQLPVDSFMARQDPPEPLRTLGFAPWRPDIAPVIGQVLDNSPAAKGGLEPGDRIRAVDGQTISTWEALVSRVQAAANTPLELQIARAGRDMTVTVTPEGREQEGTMVGFMGAGAGSVSWPQEYQRTLAWGPLGAMGQALSRTGEMTSLTVGSIGKMITGLISPSNLSGPITIARVAGDSARSGLESFISFLAYLSISLGVLNLLPVPVLDGGHLVYYVIELVRGRPVSERIQAFGLRIGMALIASLMLMAFYFDIMRL